MKRIKIVLKIGLIIPLYFVFLVSSAQELSLAKSFGGTLNNNVTDIETDNSGNIYTVGNFLGTQDFDPGEGVTNLSAASGGDIFITKSTSAGNLIWAKNFGGGQTSFNAPHYRPEAEIAVDPSSGDIYMVGNFYQDADFDPGSGTTELEVTSPGNGASDIFIGKLDSNGDLDWVHKIGAEGFDKGHDIAFGPTGDIYITGFAYFLADFDPDSETSFIAEAGYSGYLAKYSNSGSLIWANKLLKETGSNITVEGYSLAINQDNGDVFVGGVYSNPSKQGHVSKIVSSGTLVDTKEYTGEGTCIIHGVALDSKKDPYVIGSFTGTIDNLTSNGEEDIIIAKAMGEGTLWTKQFGGSLSDTGIDLSVGQFDDIYAIGTMTGTIDFDPGADVFELTGNTFLTSFTRFGDFNKSAIAFDMSGVQGNQNYATSGGFKAINSKGRNIYLGGAYANSFDIDPADNENLLTSLGSTDPFFSVFTPQPIVYNIDENASAGTIVGRIQVPNSEVYSDPSIISGNTSGAFTIDTENFSEQIEVANSAALDFETNSSFRIEVSTYDNNLNLEVATYLISLNDLPEGPEIEDQAFTIISTIETGNEIGTVVATEPEDLPLTFTIAAGNENGIFSIDESTGVIILADRSALDFESATTFDFEVSVSNGTESAQATISIIENLVPMFNWETTTFDYDENSEWYLLIPITDPDGDDLTVTIESGNTDNVLKLQNNAGQFATRDFWEIFPDDPSVGIDHEAYANFDLIIKAEDDQGNVVLSDPISININNLNDNTPTLADAEISINEGLPNGSFVTTLEGQDLDLDELTYSITSGNTDETFDIDATTGVVTVSNEEALVFTTNPTFTLIVSASDGVSSAEASLTINLEEYQGPAIEGQSFTIISTIETGNEIGTVVATEPEDLPLTFTIAAGNENGIFSIDESTGVIILADRSALDFESATTFDFEVSVSNGTESAQATISIIENLVPMFNWETTTFDYYENSEWYLLIPITDPEGDELTVTIESGNTDNVLKLQNNAGQFATRDFWEIFPDDPSVGIDHEAYANFDLIIKAEDDQGNVVLSDPISININNLNDNTPTLDNATIEISEGLSDDTLVTTLEATDLDNDPIMYSIASGNTDAAFSISDATGEITVRTSSALSFSTNPVFNLVISASDGENVGQATITINLLEASAPVIEDQSFSIVSSIETEDEVGTVQAFDAQSDAITYSITSGNTNNAFELDATSGLIKVANRDVLDFSSSNSFALNISVSDQSGSNSATITIVLNTAPTFNWTSTTFNFDENEQWFLTIPVTDGESDELTLSITSGNEANLLSIVNTASEGSVTVYEITPSAQGLNFEVDPTSFELNIDATDDAGNITTSESISISINNVNDNAPETKNETVTINQNLPNGQPVTTVSGSDADGDDLTFRIEDGNTDNAFVIDATTGDISVSNSSALVFDTNPTFELSVGVSDGVFTSTASITVNLNEQVVNTAPIIEDQTFTLLENSENGSSVGMIEATDLEGDDLTFSLISGNKNNVFLISSSTGEILVTNSEELDFETNPSFSLLISVSDGSLTEAATMTIELEDVDEAVLGVSHSEVLRVYPNPSTDYFQLSNNQDVKSIQILDASARVLKQLDFDRDNHYSLQGIKSGVYFIQVESEESTIQSRIIIK